MREGINSDPPRANLQGKIESESLKALQRSYMRGRLTALC